MFEFFKKSKPPAKATDDEIDRIILRAYAELELLAVERRLLGQDEECLPAPKERVKAALMVAIATAQNEEHRDIYRACYLNLANYQKSIGKQGISLSFATSGKTEELHRLLHYAKELERESKVLEEELQQLEAKLKTKDSR